MPFLIEYILKLSISLAVVYLFYQLLLRRLTFYHWNRWYLVVYTLLAFVIPFVNISPALQENKLGNNNFIRLIPSVQTYTAGLENDSIYNNGPAAWDKWDWILFVLASGIVLLSALFVIRFISFVNLRRKATLIISRGMRLYQVDKNIIPFSFGNSVFINQQLHTGSELKEIIRHEFVHIKQKHTRDILWCELLCIFNWYNPFAWLIRKAVRQNLEFIADNKVLENGLDKKQYQYLLLKVVGNNHFSIASQFNFSSLKKRIVMMNKMKSTRTQLLKFLFILPVVAALLLAFRNEKKAFRQEITHNIPGKYFIDTFPEDLVTSKGYFTHRTKENNQWIIIVEDRNRKVVERVPLEKWNANEDHYGDLYGYPLPPPPPPPPPAPPVGPKLPKNVSSMNVSNNKVTIVLKNGEKEKYDLNNEDEKDAFEKKYGKTESVIPPPPPPPPVPAAHTINTNVDVNTSSSVSVNVDKVAVESPVASTARVVSSVQTTKGIVNTVTQNLPVTAVAPATVSVSSSPAAPEPVHYGETFLALTIYKSTKREKLDKLIEEAKNKGVELKFDKIEYNNKNEITLIAGAFNKDKSKSTFSITDFEVLHLLVTKDRDRYSCIVYMNDQKEEI